MQGLHFLVAEGSKYPSEWPGLQSPFSPAVDPIVGQSTEAAPGKWCHRIEYGCSRVSRRVRQTFTAVASQLSESMVSF